MKGKERGGRNRKCSGETLKLKGEEFYHKSDKKRNSGVNVRSYKDVLLENMR